MLFTCQAGFETLLARELAELHGLAPAEKGPGWVRGAAVLQPTAGGTEPRLRHRATPDLAFAHLALLAPIELRGDSVNTLAGRIGEWFLASLRGERVEAAWPCVWLGPPEVVGLGRRIGAVEAAFAESLRKRLSRVARLASPELPRGRDAGPARGLFVYFADFGRVFVAREAEGYGQRRMADDDLAPSRSYLKVEEAYGLLGREPAAGETVCDLGSAPGGWSYSAAKRGARVVAVDNGPLKGGALGHPRIEHRREDAFRYRPPGSETFDWLFCDLVEEPHHVLQHIITPWLAGGWCRRLVVNLKFGRVDAVALLRELRTLGAPLRVQAPGARVRHLYHNREEFTVVGEVTGR